MNTKNSNNLNHTKGKTILRFLLCVLPIAIIGGYFTGIYTLEHSTNEVTAQILAQIKSPTAFYLLTMLQSTIYAIIASVLGYFLADRIGLLRPFAFKKDILEKTVPAIILFGILLTADYFVIGPFIPEVAADYEKGISAAYFISSLTYGGVVEEILMRWFFMSLIAWILILIFARKTQKTELPDWIFIAANITAALLFAAGHLPATMAFFGRISPLILVRCFVLNGGFALVFGRFYRKYGIQYAMLAHFGLHLISKLILLAVI
ncbi:MAG: CPBP family glutamic-type intramembrane protease [Firmicutes bacterium]|nr:CPBP family glutamic-type intramembrane protease [Bacillota bacterium]